MSIFKTEMCVRAALVAVFAFAVLTYGCKDEKTYNQTCEDVGGDTSVSKPELLMNLSIGNTGWFSSPAVYDLDGDGTKEIVAPFYDVGVWDVSGNLLYTIPHDDQHMGRVYAPTSAPIPHHKMKLSCFRSEE